MKSWALPAVSIGSRAADRARDLALPLVAVAGIVAVTDLRIPVGLPGHRGLIWLTLLVAVALSVRRPGVVTAVGAASTVLTFALGSAVGDPRYLAAAILLDATLAVPIVRRHPVLLGLAASPIHLVALVAPLLGAVGAGGALVGLGSGLATKAGFHLAFGLVAGLLGWTVAAALGCSWTGGEGVRSTMRRTLARRGERLRGGSATGGTCDARGHSIFFCPRCRRSAAES
ncbi:hypothetical protein [Pseudonocardia alaniniphila]|uniref:Uncharacterized protein n=1 Tax=Pseudonocardia alaniniphila TaxID=75291 RepID=A0ABS9TM79_9PSEU|nr:hypothetical protein [Pseudonocardia alaniniphila]MCH6169649.1 hypothetical protein [Pseudonocardia alaniniphila]